MVGFSEKQRGFTLIELSIVLVIIGLIVGGILAGRDLVRAAEARAQVTQIEKFRTAVNTFYGKYGALPGDMSAKMASDLGFTTRTGNSGEGDNNGVIEGTYVWGTTRVGLTEGQGETALFWIDLTSANGMNVNLIEGSFSTNGLGGANWSGADLNKWFPPAKAGGNNYVYVYSANATNFFGVSMITAMGSQGSVNSKTGLTVGQAAKIDEKIDDGLPQTGKVLAQYENYAGANTTPEWAGGPSAGALPGQAATATTNTCYDNGGSSANLMQYSVQMNNGNNVNCALSFQIQ